MGTLHNFFLKSLLENKKVYFLTLSLMVVQSVFADEAEDESVLVSAASESDEVEFTDQDRAFGAPYVSATGSSSATAGLSASSAPYFGALSAKVTVLSTPGAGVYTPTSGMKFVQVEALAGGGGSGGGAATTLFASAGGGAGSYSKKMLTAAQVGATMAYVVGAAGTAGASGGGAGGTGGVTTFGGTWVTTSGGVGSATASAAALAGGAGGAIGTGGIKAGNNGGSTIASMTLGMSGASGADTIYGQGGYAVPMATGANPGNAGQGYGAGAGGGTAGVSSPAVFAGAAGATGVIILTEYILA